jgi:hypothetical protein
LNQLWGRSEAAATGEVINSNDRIAGMKSGADGMMGLPIGFKLQVPPAHRAEKRIRFS